MRSLPPGAKSHSQVRQVTLAAAAAVVVVADRCCCYCIRYPHFPFIYLHAALHFHGNVSCGEHQIATNCILLPASHASHHTSSLVDLLTRAVRHKEREKHDFSLEGGESVVSQYKLKSVSESVVSHTACVHSSDQRLITTYCRLKMHITSHHIIR